MREGVSEVEKERLPFALTNKPDCLPRVASGKCVLVGRPLHDFLVAHQRHVPPFGLRFAQVDRACAATGNRVHIVTVGDAEVVIEAVVRRRVSVQVTQVPLADASCGIAPGLQCLGDSNLMLWQASGRIRKQHTPLIAAHPAADWQPSSQQRRPARRANRCRDVKVRPLLPLLGHLVDVRRANSRMTIAAWITVAQVVAEDDNEVWLVTFIVFVPG